MFGVKALGFWEPVAGSVGHTWCMVKVCRGLPGSSMVGRGLQRLQGSIRACRMHWPKGPCTYSLHHTPCMRRCP